MKPKDIHPLDRSIKNVSGGDVAPSARISAANTASFAGAASKNDFARHIDRAAKLAGRETEKATKQQRAIDRSYKPTPKEIETHFGKSGQSSLMGKALTAAVNLSTRKDNTSSPTEVRPDVPELQGGRTTRAPKDSLLAGSTTGLAAGTAYLGDKKSAHMDVRTGKDVTTGKPPEEPKRKLTGPKLGVCPECNGKISAHGITAAGRALAPEHRKPEHYIHATARAGTSAVGSKPSRPANFGTAHTRNANKPGTKSSSAGLAALGAVGRAGSEKRDIKNRSIETPKKEESFQREVYNFLEALLHVDWETHKKTGGIFKFDPNKSKFQRTKFAPVEPVQDRELPTGTAPEEKKQLTNDLSRAAANLGILGGRRVKPSTRPRTAADASKQLFGEDTMNSDKIANDIIREAFTSGGRKNTTPNDNTLSAPGGTVRQMLAGEFVGSAAWPFDQSSNDMFDGSAELQASQAQSGMGNGQGDGFQEAIAIEIVDSLLEDSPSSIYSDPQSVGYLINELQESGYTEYASTVTSICEDAKEEDVVKVVEMIDKMEAEKADPFLIEQLAKFANLLIEDDMKAADDDNPEDPNTSKEDAASKVDTGEDTGGSGL